MTDERATHDDLEPLEITIENFRGVKYAKWKPEGVCALVGPNGSGKSSLLAGFLFMHYALKKTLRDAISVSGEYSTLLHFDVPASTPVRVTLSNGRVAWTITVFVDTNGRVLEFDESLVCDGVEIDLRAASGMQTLANAESQPRLDRVFQASAEHQPLVERFREQVRMLSVFPTWQLGVFRKKAWSEAHDTSARLSHDASNIAAVLKRWEDREHREKLLWVRSTMKAIYPTMVDEIEATQEGTSKWVRCFPKAGDNRSLPLNAMSSGVLSTLFALTAVAGAPPGATLLFDEADNSLHPAALRQLVTTISERADEERITAAFATHSIVMLDQFNKHPEDVWVADAQKGVTRLTDELEPDWLATYRLGSIYGSAYGRQLPKAPASRVNDNADSHESKDSHEP